MEDELDEFIQYLVDMGIIIEHVTSTGEKKYSVSKEAETFAPDLWEAHLLDIRKHIYKMWEYGIVNITFSENGPLEDRVSLTDLAFDEETVSKLSIPEKDYLDTLIKAFHNSDLL